MVPISFYYSRYFFFCYYSKEKTPRARQDRRRKWRLTPPHRLFTALGRWFQWICALLLPAGADAALHASARALGGGLGGSGPCGRGHCRCWSDLSLGRSLVPKIARGRSGRAFRSGTERDSGPLVVDCLKGLRRQTADTHLHLAIVCPRDKGIAFHSPGRA